MTKFQNILAKMPPRKLNDSLAFAATSIYTTVSSCSSKTMFLKLLTYARQLYNFYLATSLLVLRRRWEEATAADPFNKRWTCQMKYDIKWIRHVTVRWLQIMVCNASFIQTFPRLWKFWFSEKWEFIFKVKFWQSCFVPHCPVPFAPDFTFAAHHSLSKENVAG